MKKKSLQTSLSFILLSLAILFCQKTKAQVGFTNSGFESGQNLNADNWTFIHSAKRINKYISPKNDTLTPPEGQFFLKLETTTNNSINGGRFSFGESQVMLPFIGYPDSLLMQLAHFPGKNENEYYGITCYFIKYEVDFSGPVLQFYFNGNGTTNWHHEGFGFDYSTGKPIYDSLQIVFQSSNPNQTGRGIFSTGTALLIDDIQFTGSRLAVAPSPIASLITDVFPNPCRSSATITLNTPLTIGTTLTIADMQGRILKNTPITNEYAGSNSLPIDVSDMKPGIYTVALQNGSYCKPYRLVVGE